MSASGLRRGERKVLSQLTFCTVPFAQTQSCHAKPEFKVSGQKIKQEGGE